MNKALILSLGYLLSIGISVAEPRQFTNKEGKKITAELVAVEKEKAVLKLKNSSHAKVPLTSLSESDQEYIKTWWEENKNKISSMDVRLVIDRNTRSVSRSDNKDGGGKKAKKKVSIDETEYICELKSYTKKDLANIKLDYTIYKRVSTRGEKGSSTDVETSTGTTKMSSLLAQQSQEFNAITINTEDSSTEGAKKGKTKGPSSSKRETVIGFVATLSVNGEEFLKQSYPENFITKLEEDKKREARNKR